MSDMSLLPVGSGMGSDALTAAGGAFVGGLFGNWFGNGFAGGGVGDFCVCGCKWVSYWIGEQLEYFKVSVKIDKYRRYEIMLL